MKKYYRLNKILFTVANYFINFPLIIAAISIFYYPDVITYNVGATPTDFQLAHSIFFLLYGLIGTIVPIFISIIIEFKADTHDDNKINIPRLLNCLLSIGLTIAMLILSIRVFLDMGLNMYFSSERIVGFVCIILCSLQLLSTGFFGSIDEHSKVVIKAFSLYPALAHKFHGSLAMVIGTSSLLGLVFSAITMNYYSIIIEVVNVLIIVLFLLYMIYKSKKIYEQQHSIDNDDEYEVLEDKNIKIEVED